MYRFHFLSYIIKDMKLQIILCYKYFNFLKFTIRENAEIKMNVNNPNQCKLFGISIRNIIKILHIVMNKSVNLQKILSFSKIFL